MIKLTPSGIITGALIGLTPASMIVGALIGLGTMAVRHDAGAETSGSVQVARVIDGDTFEAASGATVRIWGIDAPETGTRAGAHATATLRAWVEGKAVSCSFVEVGPYGRDIMRCDALACDLVEAGVARDWPRYSGGAYARCER